MNEETKIAQLEREIAKLERQLKRSEAGRARAKKERDKIAKKIAASLVVVRERKRQAKLDIPSIELVPEIIDGFEAYINPVTKSIVYSYSKVSDRTGAEIYFVSKRNPSMADPTWTHLQPIPKGMRFVHFTNTAFVGLKREK